MSLSEVCTNVNLIEYDEDKFMVISVPISEGNSGEWLINSFGLLRGMSTGGLPEKHLRKDTNLLGGYNINLMVPSNELIKWAES